MVSLLLRLVALGPRLVSGAKAVMIWGPAVWEFGEFVYRKLRRKPKAEEKKP